MLNIEVIKQKAAQKEVPEIIIEKAYILDWILWGITQFPRFRNSIVFKGGTALHKIYFPDWRFSEDLDFTTITRMEEKKLRKFLPEMCKLIRERVGIILRLRNIEPGGEKGREWSFETKIEYIGPRQQAAGNLPVITLHITNDEQIIDEPLLKPLANPFEDMEKGFLIPIYSLEEIFAEKLRTVLHQRCWPRDVYDLWRLFKEVGNFINTNKTYRIYEKKCSYRNVEPPLPQRFDERILRLRNQWIQGLKRQTKDVPDFSLVYEETKKMLGNFFDEEKKGEDYIMREVRYAIKYKKGDVEIEVQGDKDFVENKFRELLSLKTSALSSISRGKLESISTKKGRVSITEFLKGKIIKSHADRVLVFGYYLKKIENISPFNLNDINRCYQNTRTPKAKNFHYYIGQLISQGYLMNAPKKKNNKKAWILTDTGTEYVETLKSAKREEKKA